MIYGVTHVELGTRDLAASRAFYEEHAGFAAAAEGERHVDLDCGSLHLRLIESAWIEFRSVIHLQTQEVEDTVARLVAAGAQVVSKTTRTPEQLVIARLLDLDGHALVLWRALTEDEYERPPDLETQIRWTPEARDSLQNLLRHVPAPFRGLARRRSVSVAEELATEGRIGLFDPRLAARVFVLASPA